jgi:hypothetical protein
MQVNNLLKPEAGRNIYVCFVCIIFAVLQRNKDFTDYLNVFPAG